MRSAVIAAGLSLCLCVAPSSAQLDELKEKLGLGKSDTASDANQDETVPGLKEALRVGAEKAVRLTGREDGYFGRKAIRIPMPEELVSLEKGLRRFGQGDMVDAFVLSMNRAAEQAAPFAKDIFWDAIREMDFADARGILRGGDTAATDYFRATTTDRLTEAFLPVVREAMDSVGVTRQYKELVSRYESVPFASSLAFDVDQYTVDRALDGLFLMLGRQERKIRTDPAARVTELLRSVFSRDE